MSERTKLLKKALLTSVGATTNGERIKTALNEAFDDLAKIGQELLLELEGKGKDKAKSAQDFLKKLQHETHKRSKALEKNVAVNIEKKAKEYGLITRKDFNELRERIIRLERANSGKQPRRKKDS